MTNDKKKEILCKAWLLLELIIPEEKTKFLQSKFMGGCYGTCSPADETT